MDKTNNDKSIKHDFAVRYSNMNNDNQENIIRSIKSRTSKLRIPSLHALKPVLAILILVGMFSFGFTANTSIGDLVTKNIFMAKSDVKIENAMMQAGIANVLTSAGCFFDWLVSGKIECDASSIHSEINAQD